MSTAASTTLDGVAAHDPLRRDRLVYRITTSILALVMLLGGLGMLFWPANKVALEGLGFPGWFAGELGLAKLLGVAALVLPQVPLRAKEWAYAGFSIVLVSAALAHHFHGQPLWRSVDPLAFLVVLAFSRRSLHRLVAGRVTAGERAPA